MLNIIVHNTNAAIDTFLADKQEIIDNSDKYSFYKLVDLTEMKTFFGLLYLCARLKLNMFDHETIWHPETGNNFFEATMSLNRFTFTSGFITSDKKEHPSGTLEI